MKLRKSQEVVGHRQDPQGLGVILELHKFVPTETGVEQYVDGRLRATVEWQHWQEFVKDSRAAREAQSQDDAEAQFYAGPRTPSKPAKSAKRRR